jgi:predicted nucleotidyltransferase
MKRNPAAHDPVLLRYRRALDALYADRIERVVLFGSRARGDARPESDYDVAVFLIGLGDRWSEFDRLADLETEILVETGELVHGIPFPAAAYGEATPLMHVIRREGVDL